MIQTAKLGVQSGKIDKAQLRVGRCFHVIQRSRNR
jgi:hypothetical protein